MLTGCCCRRHSQFGAFSVKKVSCSIVQLWGTTLFARPQVGFPESNDRYVHVLKAAGDALAQSYEVPVVPLAPTTPMDSWIQCGACGKWRKVSKAYHNRNKDLTWHCNIKGSPVPAPGYGR